MAQLEIAAVDAAAGAEALMRWRVEDGGPPPLSEQDAHALLDAHDWSPVSELAAKELALLLLERIVGTVGLQADLAAQTARVAELRALAAILRGHPTDLAHAAAADLLATRVSTLKPPHLREALASASARLSPPRRRAQMAIALHRFDGLGNAARRALEACPRWRHARQNCLGAMALALLDGAVCDFVEIRGRMTCAACGHAKAAVYPLREGENEGESDATK